jgi:hypothetical protein
MHTPLKRRWWSYFRLSLRGLMVLVLVVGSGLGLISHFIRSVAVQHQTVTAVRTLGGTVFYDFQFEGQILRRNPVSNATSRDVPGWPKWIVDRLGPDCFGYVQEVSFGNWGRPSGTGPMSAKEVQAALKEMQPALTARSNNPSRTGPASGKEIDEVLNDIGQLSRLTNLSLINIPVTDSGLAHLEGLADLRFLKLQGRNKITDAGLIRLKRMTSLKQLFLDDSQITDAGLTHLKTLTDLEELGLANTQVGDAGLAHLKGLTKLNTLDLRGTQVTSAGLTHLKGLTNLRMLRIGSTKITDTGIYRLRKSLPGLWAPR